MESGLRFCLQPSVQRETGRSRKVPVFFKRGEGANQCHMSLPENRDSLLSYFDTQSYRIRLYNNSI